MKRSIVIAICIVLTFLLIGCGSGKDYSDYVTEKTFVYEKEGFYGDFTIRIKGDGTFTYYEGMASSYIGMGEWTIKQNTITLSTVNGPRTITNIFEIEKGKLIWRAEGSDNFSHVKVKDGEFFNEENNPSEDFEEIVPYDAQLEILCTKGKLVFSRIATTPQVRAVREPFDDNTCTKIYKDKHEIISELFRIMNGKEATEEHESLPTLRLFLYGEFEDEPWHYLFEFGTDGLVRVSNNGELLCFVQISEEELQSIIQVLD